MRRDKGKRSLRVTSKRMDKRRRGEDRCENSERSVL